MRACVVDILVFVGYAGIRGTDYVLVPITLRVVIRLGTGCGVQTTLCSYTNQPLPRHILVSYSNKFDLYIASVTDLFF